MILTGLLLPQSDNHHPRYQNKVKMSALQTLGLYAPFENQAVLGEGVTIYHWMINRIKCDNLTSSNVTNGLVLDLFHRVYIKKSRHDKHDPTKTLSKVEMTHILCFLISRMSLEDITAKIVLAVFKKIPKEEPPQALWMNGIAFIKKQASVGGDGGDGDGDGDGEATGGGGGAGDSGEHVADGGGGGAVVTGGQGGETGGPHGT